MKRNTNDDLYGWQIHGFTRDTHIVVSEYLLIFSALLFCSVLIQYYAGHVLKCQYLPETAATMLVGMTISLIIRLGGGYSEKNEHEDFDPTFLGFSVNVFFFAFLPPIIFNSGYHLKRRLFYANFSGIFCLAVIGTCISIAVVSAGIFLLSSATGLLTSASSFTIIECVCFASLISSTDPVSTLAVYQSLRVDPTLFYLVFGESVLNDAIAITVFRVTSKFVGYDMEPLDVFYCFINFWICFVGSCFIGYALGVMIALIYKVIDFRHHKLAAVSLFVSTIYIPFLLSEVLQLSGIVTCMFSGIASRRYINKNLTMDTRKSASFLFQLLAYLAETACFCLLGLSVFSQSISYFRFDFIAWTLALILIGRAAHVYPLLTMVNCFRRKGKIIIEDAEYKTKDDVEDINGFKQTYDKMPRTLPEDTDLISLSTMHMIFFAGLRGAVAFACANIFPDHNGNRKIVVATSTGIILITIFLGGGLTSSVTKLLNIKSNICYADYVRKLEDRDKEGEKSGSKVLYEEGFEKRVIYPLVVKGYVAKMNIREWKRVEILRHAGSMEKKRDMDSSSGGGSYLASARESVVDNKYSIPKGKSNEQLNIDILNDVRFSTPDGRSSRQLDTPNHSEVSSENYYSVDGNYTEDITSPSMELTENNLVRTIFSDDDLQGAESDVWDFGRGSVTDFD